MRIILISIFFLLALASGVQAQISGVVRYEYTKHIDRPDDLPSRVQMPEKMMTMYDLQFEDQTSMYKKDMNFKDPNADTDNRWYRRGNKPHALYYDHGNGSNLEELNLWRKDFLVNDTIAELQWKVNAAEQRDILGYAAMKATLVDTSKVVEAWFTPQIPASVGPSMYYGLPGLILAVTIDDSEIILAKTVDLEASDIAIEVPNKGKKLDRPAFVTLKEEKTAEMKKMWGNSKRRWQK